MSQTERELSTVIEQILAVVPKTEPVLRAQLTSLSGRIPYTAPELKGNLWWETASALAKAIPSPTLPWQIEVARVFTGKAEL